MSGGEVQVLEPEDVREPGDVQAPEDIRGSENVQGPEYVYPAEGFMLLLICSLMRMLIL